MHPTRLPPRLALRPGLGTDGGRCCSFSPFSLFFLLLFRYYFVTTHRRPRFPWAACRCCIIFLLCCHLFCPGPVSFPGRFVPLLFFCGARIFFLLFVLLFPIDRTLIVRSPVHVCLSLGASGYLGARQSRGTAVPRRRGNAPSACPPIRVD